MYFEAVFNSEILSSFVDHPNSPHQKYWKVNSEEYSGEY